jgi:hypothetical protein
MNWMTQLGGVLDTYHSAEPQQAPATVDRDFDRLSQVAPREAVADGLAAAFRSDATPPFPQMLGQMFGRSAGPQRASILNTLMATVGPAVLQQILSRRGRPQPAPAGAPVTPEAADQVSPEEVEELAKHAEQRDPSILERISKTYAEQPQIIKTLGAAALTVALARIAQKRGAL